MPLLRFLGVVGPALLMLLLAVNWLMPEAIAERTHKEIQRPAIRISSIEKLPERVVFDTSLPQSAIPPTAIPTAIELPQSAFAFVQITPGPLPTFSKLAEVASKKPIPAKREAVRKVATYRTPPQAHTTAATDYNVREAQPNSRPPIRTTLLDDIAGRFGQMFKVN
jgi:hypothetical protein